MTFYVHLFIHQSNDLSSSKLYELTSHTGVNQNYEQTLGIPVAKKATY